MSEVRKYVRKQFDKGLNPGQVRRKAVEAGYDEGRVAHIVSQFKSDFPEY